MPHVVVRNYHQIAYLAAISMVYSRHAAVNSRRMEVRGLALGNKILQRCTVRGCADSVLGRPRIRPRGARSRLTRIIQPVLPSRLRLINLHPMQSHRCRPSSRPHEPSRQHVLTFTTASATVASPYSAWHAITSRMSADLAHAGSDGRRGAVADAAYWLVQLPLPSNR